MSPHSVARTIVKRAIRAYEGSGVPLLPMTRGLRAPLRWLYHRSRYLPHDTRFHWRPSLLLGLHALLVRGHPSDFTIYDDQLKFRSFGSAMSLHAYYVGEVERHLVDFIVGRLRPGFTMLDVGAHHGAFTLVVAHELRKRGWQGTVHSFEPDPSNRALLEHNVRQNGLDDRVVFHAEALSNRDGEDDLIGDAAENSGNTLASTGEFSLDPSGTLVSRRVEVRRLDSLADELPTVDLVKLDIQGGEPLALEGATRLVARDRPVFVVEATEGWPSSERIKAMLIERGYVLHGVTRSGELCPAGSPESFISWDCVALPR